MERSVVSERCIYLQPSPNILEGEDIIFRIVFYTHSTIYMRLDYRISRISIPPHSNFPGIFGFITSYQLGKNSHNAHPLIALFHRIVRIRGGDKGARGRLTLVSLSISPPVRFSDSSSKDNEKGRLNRCTLAKRPLSPPSTQLAYAIWHFALTTSSDP